MQLTMLHLHRDCVSPQVIHLVEGICMIMHKIKQVKNRESTWFFMTDRPETAANDKNSAAESEKNEE